MDRAVIVYHQEAEGFWADSPDVDGFVAAGSTLAEVRQLAKEGLAFYLESDEVEVDEVMATGRPVSVVTVRDSGGDLVYASPQASAFGHVHRVHSWPATSRMGNFETAAATGSSSASGYTPVAL